MSLFEARNDSRQTVFDPSISAAEWGLTRRLAGQARTFGCPAVGSTPPLSNRYSMSPTFVSLPAGQVRTWTA